MSKRILLYIASELMFWIITAIVTFGIMKPIYDNVILFPFWNINILFIVLFITLVRYTFLLKSSWFGNIQWVKIVLSLMAPLTITYLVGYIFEFVQVINAQGIESFMFFDASEHLRENIHQYIRNEYLFFGVGSVVATVVFPIRMLISLWRFYNKRGI